MTTLTHALRGASWLGIFKFFTQIISWSGTIIVARLLTSEDYGVMEMATVFTGYITYFVEFGVGTALVNKEDLKDSEKSSAFWCMALWGLVLSSLCIVLAPITSSYFNEPRIDPLTRSVAFLFIFGSLGIIPRSLMQRELRFKELGLIEAFTAFVSVLFSVVLAYLGAGAWTLIGSFIFREFLNMTCYFIRSKFRPTFQIHLSEVVPFLKFGLPVVISSSLYYLYTKADRFFGGSALGAEMLGYYAVALQLAAIPVEKIVTLIQGVLYPTLCRVKDYIDEFKKIYLCFISIVALVTFPVYFSGYILADEVIPYVIGEKWRPAMPSFKLLLIGQLIMAISSPNTLIHFARGKPAWNMIFNAILAPVLIVAFHYTAGLKDLDILAAPWILVYPIFTFSYILITNREVGIPFLRYLKAYRHPFAGSVLVAVFVMTFKINWLTNSSMDIGKLIVILLGSIATYVVYFLTFGRNYTAYLKSVFNGIELEKEQF